MGRLLVPRRHLMGRLQTACCHYDWGVHGSRLLRYNARLMLRVVATFCMGVRKLWWCDYEVDLRGVVLRVVSCNWAILVRGDFRLDGARVVGFLADVLRECAIA